MILTIALCAALFAGVLVPVVYFVTKLVRRRPSVPLHPDDATKVRRAAAISPGP